MVDMGVGRYFSVTNIFTLKDKIVILIAQSHTKPLEIKVIINVINLLVFGPYLSNFQWFFKASEFHKP